jgi:hypothetical protein
MSLCLAFLHMSVHPSMSVTDGGLAWVQTLALLAHILRWSTNTWTAHLAWNLT